VLTGDIMHAKTELSPESISMTYHFLKELSSITTVILIPGNHDTNLSNKQRLDALSPIVQDIGNLANLHYLKNSGFYLYHNIIFGVTSIFDQALLTAKKLTKDMLSHFKKRKHTYNIALYHGAVHSAQTDVGYRMNTTEILADDFDGYDYVMLGDIHRFQYMNEAKTIAYAGSLIQQSHGESLGNHGVLQWDLKTGESNLLEIKNDWGYCTISITDGQMDLSTFIPPKPKIRFVLDNTNEVQYHDIIKKIESEYEVCEIVKESNFKLKIRPSQLKKSNKMKTANVIQADMMKEYLEKKKLSEDKIKSILGLHQKIHQEVGTQKKNCTPSKNQTWKILQLKFSNTLSYGKNNIIDFRNYEPNQIIGIVAPNRYGKSAILDIILFCLFDKMSRGERRDILNKNENHMCCSLLFRIGKTHYLIERIGKRGKTGLNVKIDVNFYKMTYDQDGNETKEKLNGLDKNDTNKKITDLVGDYSDYLTTCFCLQNAKTNNFIDMTQLQKKEYLNEILKLNVFEDCHELAKDKLKELSGQLKILERNIVQKSVSDLKEKIGGLKKGIVELENEQTLYQDVIQDNLDYLVKIHKQKAPVMYHELQDYNLESTENISKTISKLQNKLEKLPVIDINHINSTISKLNSQLEKLELKLTKNDYNSKLEGLRENLEKLLSKLIHMPDNQTNINRLHEEKNTSTARMKQIKQMLSKNFPIDLNKKLNLITNLKEEIANLKKQMGVLNLPDEPNYQEILNLKLDTVDMLGESANYFASQSYDKVKLTWQMQTYDKIHKHLELNVADMQTYMERSDDPLLQSILLRDTKWIRNYEQWKLRMQKLSEQPTSTNPEKKINKTILQINESLSNLVSATCDIISYWDTYLISKQIEVRENQLNNLSEYTGSKKGRDILEAEFEMLEQKVRVCDQSVKVVTEYELNTKNNKRIQVEIDKAKAEIKSIENEENQINNEIKETKEKINEFTVLLENHQTTIDRHAQIVLHLKLLHEYQTLFIANECTNGIHDHYAELKTDSETKLTKISIDLAQKRHLLESHQKELDTYLSSRKEFDKMSDEANLYKLYVQLMDYNGLPYEILKDYLPLIGSDINQILHSMVNFDIEFMFYDEAQVAEQKTKNLKSNQGSVNINICHKKMKPYNVQLASGFEKFIIGLAIRMTLGQISLSAKPNFLIIDEGWSCLDSEYKNNITNVMSYIKNQYTHVIVISHLEEMKNQIDYTINIERVNNYSYVDTRGKKFAEKKQKKEKVVVI
jgi:DNA repair exonuclease SbcCD ATPase subunit